MKLSQLLSGKNGCRAIAAFEAGKAILIVTMGLGLLSLIHHDVGSIAANIVKHLQINPASKYPQIFIAASRHLTDARLWLLAWIALLDAIVRAIEAVGLWQGRPWGKWIGIVSGTIYLPYEAYELSLGMTWLKFAFFATNIAIVAYLGYALRRSGWVRKPGWPGRRLGRSCR